MNWEAAERLCFYSNRPADRSEPDGKRRRLRYSSAPIEAEVVHFGNALQTRPNRVLRLPEELSDDVIRAADCRLRRL